MQWHGYSRPLVARQSSSAAAETENISMTLPILIQQRQFIILFFVDFCLTIYTTAINYGIFYSVYVVYVVTVVASM